MILPDHEICALGENLITPFQHPNVQPASVDLTLDDHVLVPREAFEPIELIDIKATPLEYDEHRTSLFVLEPQAFVLGSTAETVTLPANLVGRVEGKSSLGRLGLLVHSTAGFIDPGFEGKITLEFCNLSDRKIVLQEGLRICQVSFTELTHECRWPYGSEKLRSKYQGQSKTTPSRYEG